ncbi:MAG: hypothetical protein P8J35_08360 [Candidatus Marinimicrobia bacterium]|nr:hypothetical protein [Candidatus Neomarinimicrobiota bacterium]
MDLSGMAGTIVELDESAERQETLSGLNMPGFQAGLVSSLQTFDIHEDGESACAVLDDNSLWCWGSGSNYALGRGSSNSATTPQAVGRPGGWVNKTISVSLGGQHNCELLSTGDVQCWGTNYPTGTSTPGGSADSFVTEPEPVSGLARDAVLVASGAQHSCAILDNGSVQCWGYNQDGQLGLGYRCVTGAEGSCAEDSLGSNYIGFPRDMILPAGKTAIGLNVWYDNTCVILNDNSYVCTGYLDGVHHSTPIYVNGSYRVAFADEYSAVSTSGEYLWLGQQANHVSNTEYGMQTYDRNSANTSYTTQEYHNDSIRSLDGRLYYWGYSEGYGSCVIYNDDVLRCGHLESYTNSPNDYYGYLTFAAIENPTGLIPAAVVSKSLKMSCVVYDDGSLKCWGINNAGQIGDGSVCVYGTSDTTGCTSGNYVNSLREVSIPAGRHVALSDLDIDGFGKRDVAIT